MCFFFFFFFSSRRRHTRFSRDWSSDVCSSDLTLSIRGVRRVAMHEPLTNLRPVIFVQYAAGTPRTEVWRGLHGAASLNAIAGKILIGVSEDIDPDNLDAVMWAIAYRCNPVEDVHISPYHGGVQGAQYGDGGLGSKLLI